MKYLLTALLISFASPLYANPVFKEYVEWIVNNSDFEYNGEELPTVKRIPKEWMEVYAYGGETVADSEKQGTTLPEVLALYDNENDQMIIPEDLDLNDFGNHHIVVHELVHYLQDINGYYETKDAQDCPQSLEPPAYELHVKWMDEVDHPGERPNELFVFMLSMACEEHFHGGG